MKKHISQVFKFDPNPVPWPRMILCAVATTLPLIAGLTSGHLAISVYGALTGCLLSLNDHLGPTANRIWVTTLTYLQLLAGFIFGFFLKTHPVAFLVVISFTVYWLGLLSGDGAELERGILFWLVAIVIVYFSKNFSPSVVQLMLFFSFLAYGCLLTGIPLLVWLKKHQTENILGFKEAFKKSLTKRRERHLHAAFYTMMVLISVWASLRFEVERGYWITITVLLVMRSDRTQSLYKTTQRLLGTALGVLYCDIVFLFTYDPWVLIFFVMLSVLLLPLALKRNYLLASGLVTVFIVLLLEMAAMKHGVSRIPFVRLQATFYGCLLSVIGTTLSKAAVSVGARLKQTF